MSTMKRDAFIIALNVYVARPENGIVAAQRELFDAFVARLADVEYIEYVSPTSAVIVWKEARHAVSQAHVDAGNYGCGIGEIETRETLIDFADAALSDDFAARIVSIYPAPSKRTEPMTINVPPGSWFSSR